MGKTICISNHKGGTGKTTTAVNLSTALALAEKRTLLIDLDLQGHATKLFNATGNDGQSIYDILTGQATAEDRTVKTGIDFLKIIPSDRRLIGADYDLRAVPDRELILKNQLGNLTQQFDYIIIDSPPSFNIAGINGINAADSVLIPLQCEFFALESLGQYFKIFNYLVKKHGTETEVDGILLNMYDPSEDVSTRIAGQVKRSFEDMVYKTVIPRSRCIRESASFGKPVILSDIMSKGAKSFISLAREIIGTGNPFEE